MATVVDHHPMKNEEDGYSLEVFAATGGTLLVVAVPESAIRFENRKKMKVFRFGELGPPDQKRFFQDRPHEILSRRRRRTQSR
ncbi:MAG: hypothetical protein ACLFTV_17260, partial [Desulfococcaceae bacterium]